MRFGSVCSGIEAASVAWHPLGWKAAWLSEIEPFPCAVLAHHYPDTPNLGDMTTLPARIQSGEVEAPDVLCGGTPCFTAGHLVLTTVGYVPIEHVQPGDQVVTHTGKVQRVVRVGSKRALVGELRGVGIRTPFRVTPEHPFLAVHYRTQNTRRNGQYARVEFCDDSEWVEAKDMPGRNWCALTNYDIPSEMLALERWTPEQVAYLAGAYLGDGHIREFSKSSKAALVLSLNEAKLAKVKALGITGTVTTERTSTRLTIYCTELARWLEQQFGRLAQGKRLPAWVLGSSLRAHVLQGYLDTDGSRLDNGVSASTVSQALAYGICDLLNAEGYVASVAYIKTAPKTVIQGREVNQRDYWQVRGFLNSRKSRRRHQYLLRKVQSFTIKEEDTVFNIEVEGDNSYVVNGCIVHNCQAFSVAGLRQSLDDARGNLSLVFCEVANVIDSVRRDNHQPASIIFWENVPGVLSTKDNAFGCFLAGLAGETEPLVAPGGKWTDAGCVLGPQRAVAWRTLDAQYFGLAQRRRRVFVVASARDGFDPAAVLLEFEGVRRDSAPSREARQVAPTIPARSTGGGGLGTDFDCDGGVITLAHGQGGAEVAIDRAPTLTCIHEAPIAAYPAVTHSLRAEGFDASEDGTGRGTPLVPIAWTGDGVTADPISAHEGRTYTHEGSVFRMHNCVQQPVPTAEADRPTIVAPTITATNDPSRSPQSTEVTQQVAAVHSAAMQVRRLTPTECERLQGFPDGYTAIPWKRKPASECPDGPRYKALGNSWAVPVVRWIGRRIADAVAALET